tara:strand:- start:3447 stop:3770 length:324 start_codon:yes stop_codon:yes gene_type:complete
MAKPKKKGGPKQYLRPEARARKAERDLCYAKGWVWNKESGACSKSGEGTSTSYLQRKKKKLESQKINCKDGYDYDHNTKKCVPQSHNRGGTQAKNKKDGTKAENTKN